MREPLYMTLNLSEDGPDTTYFDELVDGHVHSIGLSDYKPIWDFISLVDHRYVGGLYLPDNKLAECANGYQSYTATPTGFADTIWWNSEVGVVCGTDSAYEMMVDTVIPLLLGKSDVMAAVLGTGRMAKAAENLVKITESLSKGRVFPIVPVEIPMDITRNWKV